MLLEEREQVVGEVVAIAVGGVGLDLEQLVREPVRRELVKGEIDFPGRRRIGLRWAPDAEIDVAQHHRELALGHRQRPAVLGLSERRVLALPVGAEAQRETRLARYMNRNFPLAGGKRWIGRVVTYEAGDAIGLFGF